MSNQYERFFAMTVRARYCALALSVAGVLFSADWPCWRGPEHNGISTETIAEVPWRDDGPTVLWRVTVGRGFSSCAVAAGRVYTIGNRDEKDTVFCFDALTGTKVWEYSYPCGLHPLSYEGGPGSTPAVDEGRVYTLSKFGHAFCFDAATGAVRWARQFDNPGTNEGDYGAWWGFAGSPLVTGDRVIYPVGTAGVAVDTRNGAILWNNGNGRPGYSSPVPLQIAAVPCFAFVSGHEVVAARQDSGAVLWKIPWRTTWDQNAADVIADTGMLFVSSGHSKGAALFDVSGAVPAERWRNKKMCNELGSSVLWNGYLYGFDYKRLSCVNWKTGDVMWSTNLNRLGTLLISDGKIVALTEDGTLSVVTATELSYQPLAAAKVLSGRCWSAPAFSGGLVYVRNAAGELVCADMRGK
ncbi:MAG: PQQ-binding-like beta-propeller repeat protein [Spirochaetes bacterium]|nr:PQQ-binding-like beta-propeller repeat protein [Spirochaetota bacterium]